MSAGEELVLVMEVGEGRTYCVTNRPTEDGGWVSTHEDITSVCAANESSAPKHAASGGRKHPGNAGASRTPKAAANVHQPRRRRTARQRQTN